MWDLIINPFVTLLTLMYSWMGQNIVVAIIAFTVIIRLVTYPLTVSQMNSSKKMQVLQPELKKLQDKYKDDREKLAQEQMKLYSEAGISPLSGCLPLLIQFPILIGLYQAIYFALAATPFQLVDLSERMLIPGLNGLIPLQNTWLGMNLTQPPTPPVNPAYALALPAIVMVTTWLQFKMTMPKTAPATDDASNQMASVNKSMGTIMPVMFGFLSLSFSVGLSIYFAVSNIIGILFYIPQVKAFLDRIFGGGRKPKEPVLAEATVGAGKGRKLTAVSSTEKPEKGRGAIAAKKPSSSKASRPSKSR